MKIKKIIITSLCLFTIILFCNIHKINAAFNLDTNTATYDSNTGILTINHSSFHPDVPGNRYVSYLNKIKLGNISPSGYYEFKDGSLKIYVKNRNEINQQDGFNINNIIRNALSLSNGAISNIYTPPGGINVVMDNPSYPRTLDVNVIGIKPRMSIDSFSSNITRLSTNGGEIILTVRGTNLDQGTFQIRNPHTTMKYNLDVSPTIATARIKCAANGLDKNRIDTFVLYLNGFETDKKVAITIDPEIEHDTNDKPSNPSEPNNPDNSNSSNEPNKPSNPSEPKNPNEPSNPSEPKNPNEPSNPSEPNNSDNSSSSNEPNNPNNSSNGEEDTIQNKNDNNIDSIEQTEENKQTEEKKKSKIINIILFTAIPLLGSAVGVIIIMRKKSKNGK